MTKILQTIICLILLPYTLIAVPGNTVFVNGEIVSPGKQERQEIQQDDSIQFINPVGTTVVKRKSPVTIRWKGNQAGTVYYIELFKGGIYQKQIAEVTDTNEYEWQVEKDVIGGKDYQLRLVNGRFFGDFTMSENFRIKNKIPRAFWVLPAAVGAAGFYFLIKIILDSQDDVEDLPPPIEPN